MTRFVDNNRLLATFKPNFESCWKTLYQTKMKKSTILFVSLCISLTSLFSQSAETGVQGMIVDENKDPITFATLTLFNLADSSMAKAGYTDEDGSFIMTHLQPGTYYLNISFVGYDTYVSEPISVLRTTSAH